MRIAKRQTFKPNEGRCSECQKYHPWLNGFHFKSLAFWLCDKCKDKLKEKLDESCSSNNG